MERNNLKNHHTIVGRSMKEPINIINRNNHKARNSWEYCTSHDNHHSSDLLSGYLWNPRSYNCSFCKKEFRSAQALGGHMNVHRRDRARLRQYSPPNLNPIPNPNPLINLNHSPNAIPNSNQHTTSSYLSKCTSPSVNCYQITTAFPPTDIRNWVTESSLSHYQGEDDLDKVKYSKALFGMGSLDGFRNENVCQSLKDARVARLDLEIGLITHGKEAMDLDLDLELRLGR